MREHFPKQVLDTLIPRSVRISEAPSYGQSVISYDTNSPGSLSYREAAAEIARRGAPLMATKRTGLGRGIGALIPTDDGRRPPGRCLLRRRRVRGRAAASPCPGARLANLSPDDIVPNPQQPRTDFRKEELDELVVSVREFGVLQPIVVRPRVGAATGEPQYELIMGERRLRATKLAGLDSIPAVVKNTADEVMLRDALLENLHRADLNPLEEASAYQQLPRRLRHHPGAARRAHRPFAPADHQHHPAAAAAGVDPAPGGRRRAHRRTRASDPVGRRLRMRWSASPTRS